MIDLHSHTTASDGQHSPTELVQLAFRAGVTHLAVTDHDTVSGLAEATQAAAGVGMELVCGIELSAFVHRKEVHILGHFIQPENAELATFSELLRKERYSRMVEMVRRTQALGFPITLEDVLQVAGDAHLGRPHLARVFVEKGYCVDLKEVFDLYLADGKPAHVERYKLTYEEAIRLIRNAGGAATLAHPAVSKVERYELDLLKQAGLTGLEVFHSDQLEHIRQRLLNWSRDLDLVPTAGSDFHGESITPGRKLGTAHMDPSHFATLKARLPVPRA